MARTITGVVASDKANKTIVIAVHTRKTHPIYKKQYTVTTKFMAHDENNEAKEGDKVVIVETRPLSARKRFALQKIVETARIQHVEDTPEILKEKVKEEVEIEKPKRKPAAKKESK
jgi:small subunit ribosomal protein S17